MKLQFNTHSSNSLFNIINNYIFLFLKIKRLESKLLKLTMLMY